MNRNPKFSRISILVLSGLLTLTGCSSPTTEVTDNEALAFSQQAQGSSTYLARFKNKDDWKDLASAVCDSFAGGQSYKNVSETVGAYIELPAHEADVDIVISSALDNVCPELK